MHAWFVQMVSANQCSIANTIIEYWKDARSWVKGGSKLVLKLQSAMYKRCKSNVHILIHSYYYLFSKFIHSKNMVKMLTNFLLAFRIRAIEKERERDWVRDQRVASREEVKKKSKANYEIAEYLFLNSARWANII